MDKITNNFYVKNTESTSRENLNNKQNFYTCSVESTNIILPPPIDQMEIKQPYVVIGDTVEIPESAIYNPKAKFKYFASQIFGKYNVEENKGINKKNASDEEVCLAMYAAEIADQMSNVGFCYTGVKKTFQSAGIINNYDDMPRGEAKDSISYFEENSERFRKLDVEEDDLKNLSAGKIVVFTKDGKAGHICITNGNGQAMSSSTDNMGWLDAEGDGADFVVYELTEGWQYNKETRKLEFTEP